MHILPLARLWLEPLISQLFEVRNVEAILAVGDVCLLDLGVDALSDILGEDRMLAVGAVSEEEVDLRTDIQLGRADFDGEAGKRAEGTADVEADVLQEDFVRLHGVQVVRDLRREDQFATVVSSVVGVEFAGGRVVVDPDLEDEGGVLQVGRLYLIAVVGVLRAGFWKGYLLDGDVVHKQFLEVVFAGLW